MKEKLKALIVDDEMDICFLLSSILKNKNLQTSWVNSISEARGALLRYDPAVVFLDNHLPDGLGMNFIEEVKKLTPGAKIVMITAHDSLSDREKAFQQGVDHFIGKPFTQENILATIETLNNKDPVNL